MTNRLTKIPEKYLSISEWPAVDESRLSRDDKRRYARLRDGLQLYLAAQPMKDVARISGVGERRFHTLVTRCVKFHDDGRIWGLRALVSGARVSSAPTFSSLPKQGDRKSGYRGLFAKFMREHQGIENSLIKELRGKGRHPSQLNELAFSEVYKTFRKLCTSSGVNESEYPFNTEGRGRRPLRNWMRGEFLRRYTGDWIAHKYGPSAAQAWTYSGGDGEAITPPALYSMWQVDEVTVDVEAKFIIPNMRGDWEEVDVRRSFVLRVIDVGGAARIANRLVLASQASAEDITTLFWDAIAGKDDEDAGMTALGEGRMPGAGYPSVVIPELRFAVPRYIYLDNALAHLADHVQHTIADCWGGVVKLGSPMTPQERALIEAEFSAQARKLLRKLPAATGSNPRDPVRKTAKVELEDRIDTIALEKTLDSYVANENALPAARSGNIPPLVRLRRQLDAGVLKPLYLSAAKRRPHYFSKPQRVVIHVDVKSGRRPYVNFLYQRYSSKFLKTQVGLKGKVLWARADFKNLQSILLFNDDGTEFGPVDLLGPWGKFPHDVRIRKLFGRLKRRGELGEHAEDRPLETLFDSLRSRSQKDRRAAQQLAYLVTYLGRHSSRLFPTIRAELEDWVSSSSAAEQFKSIALDTTSLPVQQQSKNDDTMSRAGGQTGGDGVNNRDGFAKDVSRLPMLPRRVTFR